MPDIVINRVVKCQCGKDVPESANFCPYCGHHFRSMRSANEIQAEIEKLKKLPAKEIRDAVFQILVAYAFEWCLGSNLSPVELLSQIQKEKQTHG